MIYCLHHSMTLLPQLYILTYTGYSIRIRVQAQTYLCAVIKFLRIGQPNLFHQRLVDLSHHRRQVLLQHPLVIPIHIVAHLLFLVTEYFLWPRSPIQMPSC